MTQICSNCHKVFEHPGKICQSAGKLREELNPSISNEPVARLERLRERATKA